MDITKLTDMLTTKAADMESLGGTLKMVIGDGIVFIDGAGDKNVISNDDKEADCTVSTDEETFKGMINGDLNPISAVMSGQVKIDGDMPLAMKIQAFFE